MVKGGGSVTRAERFYFFLFHEERTTLPWKALLHKVLKIFHKCHRIRCLCKNLLRGIVPVERDSSKLWSVAPEVLLLMAVASVAVSVTLPRAVAVAGLLAVAAALGVPLVAVALSKKDIGEHQRCCSLQGTGFLTLFP